MQGLNKASNKVVGIISQKQEALEKAYKDKKISEAEYEERKRQYENSKLILNSITGALGTPSSGAGGIIAQGVSPFVAKQIGDYFAENNKTGSLSHGLAHAFLAGAVAAAGGNNIGTAALVAGGAEVIAPVLSNFLYGTTDSSKLTEAQKRTISSISSLAGMAAGASTGNITDIVSTGQAAKNAVENNYLKPHEFESFAKELANCSDTDCQRNVYKKYQRLSDKNIYNAAKGCLTDPSVCSAAAKDIANSVAIVQSGKIDGIYREIIDNNFDNLSKHEKEVLFQYAFNSFNTLSIEGNNQQSTLTASMLKPIFNKLFGGTNVDIDEARGVFAAMAAGTVRGKKSNVHKGSKHVIWSTTKNKSSVENAWSHFKKHKNEFPELKNAKQYVEATKKFLNKPPKGTLIKTNNRGDKLMYNPSTNTFGVLSKDGVPRTMFRPKDGINYWNRQ